MRVLSPDLRTPLKQLLRAAGIEAVTHYEPLHSAPAGLRFGRKSGTLGVTDLTAATLLRLPLDPVISEDEQVLVVDALRDAVFDLA